MIEEKLIPRFCDTDALGHINNTTYFEWFEGARKPIFEVFIPSLEPKEWNLIIAKIEIDFLAQGEFKDEVLVKTGIEKIGNSSLTVVQESHQNGVCTARAKIIIIHFDYKTNKSKPISDQIKQKLQKFII